MAESYLEVRLNALRRAQNADGGWGYFPGRQSWLEPTVYGAFALLGEPAADRAWSLLKGWQNSDGSWRPSSDVAVANFGTALCVMFAVAKNGSEDAIANGVKWLLGTWGAESNFLNRFVARAGFVESERDRNLKGWPWSPGTSSWVEPTAQSLIALKKAGAKLGSRIGSGLAERVRLGEAQLLDVRCRDGGWNYGSREALKIDLPSYPETTGIALAGLQGHSGLGASLDYAAREVGETKSPLGRAWLAIALRLHGARVPETPASPLPADLQILALEALAAPEGNLNAFRTEAAA